MCELTTKQDMLLYLNHNKYKYYGIRFSYGLLYAITRLSFIPILLSLIDEINLISSMCVVVLFIYSLKSKRIFIDDLNLMSWAMSVILVMHTIHKYLQDTFIDKFDFSTDEAKGHGNTNFYYEIMKVFMSTKE